MSKNTLYSIYKMFVFDSQQSISRLMVKVVRRD